MTDDAALPDSDRVAPLMFLTDHPTTGGYPVVAVADRQDLPGRAHLRPGGPVRFGPS